MQAHTAKYNVVRSTTARRRNLSRRVSDVVKCVWDRVNRDDISGTAAQVSFFFVLSLFPFFLVLAAIVGWLPSTTLWASLTQWVMSYFPRLTRHLIFTTVLDLHHGYTGFLSIGLATTLWSASTGFMSLMAAMTYAYGGKRDRRAYWKQRLIAIGATIGAAIFFLVSFGLWTAGNWIVNNISARFQTIAGIETKWQLAWWLVTLLFLWIGVDLLNYFLPAGKRRWRWISPGTVFFVLTFGLGTFGLNLYVRFSTMLPKIYGTLAGFIILMMWVYIGTLILLVAAETDQAVDELHQQEAAA